METATYTGTQLFYGMDAKTFAATLKQNGLIVPSGHYMLGLQKMNGAETKERSYMNGTKQWTTLRKPALSTWSALIFSLMRGSIDHYKEMAGQFNKAAERCKKAEFSLLSQTTILNLKLKMACCL